MQFLFTELCVLKRMSSSLDDFPILLTCMICIYRTNNENLLKKHLQIEHNIDSQLDCPNCGLNMESEAALEGHISTDCLYRTGESPEETDPSFVKVEAQEESPCSPEMEVDPLAAENSTTYHGEHDYIKDTANFEKLTLLKDLNGPTEDTSSKDETFQPNISIKQEPCDEEYNEDVGHSNELNENSKATFDQLVVGPPPPNVTIYQNLTIKQEFCMQEELFQCTECNVKFEDQANLTRHFSLVHSKKYSCKQCNIEFIDEKYFKKHKELVHEKDNLRIYRTRRGIKYIGPYRENSPAKKRRRSSADDDENYVPKGLSINTKQRDASKRNLIQCEHCIKKFISRDKLLRHIQEDHEISMTRKRKRESSNTLQEFGTFARKKFFGKPPPPKDDFYGPPIRRSPPKIKSEPKISTMLNCPLCSFETDRQDHLITHIKQNHNKSGPKVTNNNNEICPSCKTSFSNETEFRQHSCLKIKEEETHRCFYCNFTCSDKDSLTEHSNNVHLTFNSFEKAFFS